MRVIKEADVIENMVKAMNEIERLKFDIPTLLLRKEYLKEGQEKIELSRTINILKLNISLLIVNLKAVKDVIETDEAKE